LGPNRWAFACIFLPLFFVERYPFRQTLPLSPRGRLSMRASVFAVSLSVFSQPDCSQEAFTALSALRANDSFPKRKLLTFAPTSPPPSFCFRHDIELRGPRSGFGRITFPPPPLSLNRMIFLPTFLSWVRSKLCQIFGALFQHVPFCAPLNSSFLPLCRVV